MEARLGYPNELEDRFHHVRAIALDLHQQALENSLVKIANQWNKTELI